MGVLFLPVLYVLGIGPAYGFSRRFPTSSDFLENCYTSLGFLGENIPSFGRILEWYKELFA